MTGSWAVRCIVKHYFWVCLCGCFQKRLSIWIRGLSGGKWPRLHPVGWGPEENRKMGERMCFSPWLSLSLPHALPDCWAWAFIISCSWRFLFSGLPTWTEIYTIGSPALRPTNSAIDLPGSPARRLHITGLLSFRHYMNQYVIAGLFVYILCFHFSGEP